MATRGDDITKLLYDLVAPIQKLNLLLQQDRVSYELVRGDIESLLYKKKQGLEELEAIKQENERCRQLGAAILDAAKEQAAQIMVEVNRKRVEAEKLMKDAETHVKAADKKVHEQRMATANK